MDTNQQKNTNKKDLFISLFLPLFVVYMLMVLFWNLSFGGVQTEPRSFYFATLSFLIGPLGLAIFCVLPLLAGVVIEFMRNKTNIKRIILSSFISFLLMGVWLLIMLSRAGEGALGLVVFMYTAPVVILVGFFIYYLLVQPSIKRKTLYTLAILCFVLMVGILARNLYSSRFVVSDDTSRAEIIKYTYSTRSLDEKTDYCEQFLSTEFKNFCATIVFSKLGEKANSGDSTNLKELILEPNLNFLCANANTKTDNLNYAYLCDQKLGTLAEEDENNPVNYITVNKKMKTLNDINDKIAYCQKLIKNQYFNHCMYLIHSEFLDYMHNTNVYSIVYDYSRYKSYNPSEADLKKLQELDSYFNKIKSLNRNLLCDHLLAGAGYPYITIDALTIKLCAYAR